MFLKRNFTQRMREPCLLVLIFDFYFISAGVQKKGVASDGIFTLGRMGFNLQDAVLHGIGFHGVAIWNKAIQIHNCVIRW